MGNKKRTALFNRWLSPRGVRFADPETKDAYQRRVHRFKDAIELKKKPDRVPVFPLIGFFPAFYTGITFEDAMYDYDKLCNAWTKYVLDFEPDAHPGAHFPGPGRFFEHLDYKLYAWPGHGTAPNFPYQCMEDEYMRADEYEELILDPSHYLNKRYMSRIFGKLDAFKELPSMTGLMELPFTALSLATYGLPHVQKAFNRFLEAAREALTWRKRVYAWNSRMASLGFPNLYGGYAKAPFDVLGDTLRGSKGMVLDMYRQPVRVLAALDRLVPLMIDLGVQGAVESGNPIVLIPLHKGDDQFMSDEQFNTFYWPSFRRVLIGLIEEGCVPYCYAEGRYDSRLEIIRDIPKGSTIWAFDQIDMARAKQVLGDVACIGGDISSTLLCFGTQKEVKEATQALIDTAAEGGGFMLITGDIIDEARPANLKVMIEVAKTYGRY